MRSSTNWWSASWYRVNRIFPTPKLSYLVMVLAMASLAMALLHILMYFLVLAVFCIIVALLFEVYSLPAHDAVFASRDIPRLLQNTEALITIQFTIADEKSRSMSSFLVMLQDDYPEDADAPLLPLTVRALTGKTTITYVIRAKRRGDVSFGDLHLRIFSRFGLLCRQYQIPCQACVAVWPDLRLTVEKQAALQRSLHAQGVFAQRLSSGNAEFAHIRDYEMGDDPRSINWFATARRSLLLRNVYQPERLQHIILAIDCGRTMGVLQDAYKTRLDLAIEAAMLTATSAVASGDDVSILAFCDRLVLHQKNIRTKQALHELQKELYRLEAKPVYSGFHIMSDAVYKYHRRHALVCVFTDLADLVTNDLFEQNARVLAKYHTLAVASFTDEALEDAVLQPITALDQAVLAGTSALLLNERQALKDRMSARGIEIVESREEVFTAALRTYVAYKNKHPYQKRV